MRVRLPLRSLAALLAVAGLSGCDCGGTKLKNVPEPPPDPELCLDPASGVDFGAMTVGSTATKTLQLKNCGGIPFQLTAIHFSENGSSGNFHYTAPATPTLPATLQVGDKVTLSVVFQPKSVGSFTAAFAIATDFQHGTVPVIGKGSAAPCGAGNQPTAVIGIKSGNVTLANGATVTPLSTISFDGSGSRVPRGGARYTWNLTEKPGAENLILNPGTPQTASLFASESGTYVVSLVVADQYGCASDPVTATVNAKANGALHVELTWAEDYGDVDIHLLGPSGKFDDDGSNGSLFGGGNGTDCFYADCKKNPTDSTDDTFSIDWGRNGTCSADGTSRDDPTLDIDDLWGNGPENITDVAPFDATYTVVVHYYCSRQQTSSLGGYGRSQGATTATVKIFVDGVQQQVLTHSLTQRDLWRVATVKVSGGQITVTPINAPSTLPKSTGSLDACTDDTN